MSGSSERLVWLRGGLVVPIDPYLLVLRLESEGFHIRLDIDDAVLVAPADRLGSEDLTALRRWRRHVRLILRYTPDDGHLLDTASVAGSGEVSGRATR